MAESTFDWGSLLGSLGSAAAAYYAGDKLSDAQKKALDAQLGAAGTAGAALAPYQAIGTSAADALRTGDYTGTQLYKTGLSQSEQAINRGLASRGQYGSGGAMKALGENAQNYNTNYTNTLGNLARLGLGATQQANQITTGAGNSAAASGIGQTQSNLAGLTGMAGALSSYLAGRPQGGQPGQTNLGSLISGIGSAGSSLLDWYNNQRTDTSNQDFNSAPNMSAGGNDWWYDQITTLPYIPSYGNTMPDWQGGGHDYAQDYADQGENGGNWFDFSGSW